MGAPDIAELTVAGVQSGFASGEFSCEELTRAFLARIERFNPRYNAIITPNPGALEDARAVDRRRAAGEALSPLAGVPVVIKDPMDMAGLPTTGGWSLLHGPVGGTALVPATDSPVVARMRAAGAVMLGKTNVPVLSASGTHANDSWAGPTLNAAMPDRAPGASSAGTATAVAASFCVLGLAEETGGSIQNPAAAQGLVGIKPSFGLVPNTGVLPLSSLRDVVGPIARTVRDAALCLDVLAGFTMADPKTAASIGHIPAGGYAAGLRDDALRGARLGLYGRGWRDAPLGAETATLYARAQAELVGCGAALVEDPFAGTGFAALALGRPEGSRYDARGLESLPYDMEQYLRRLGPAAPFGGFAALAAATAAEDPFAPGARLGYLTALPGFAACRADPATPPDMSGFIRLREAYLAIVAEVMTAVRLDALVFPQMRDELPPLFGEAVIQATTVSEINVAGMPGVVVPAGQHASGAPFCLIFVGPPWSEARLLALAHAYEQATRHRRAPVLAV